MNSKVKWSKRLIGSVMFALLFTGVIAQGATITLDYNGFNPGTDVTVFKTSVGIGTPVATQVAAVAGDSETTFVFTLTDADTYTIDLWGDTSDSSTRASHRITFYFDGTDIDSVGDGGSGAGIKVTGFTANDTTLTLNSIPVYIDPDGFNPPDDIPDGYMVQGEVGSSGRITLDGGIETFANGGRATTLVNGIRYMIHYFNDRDSLGNQFILSSGVVSADVGLIDVGSTTDASGNEAGSTHQLVRLNKTSINIVGSPSHVVELGDGDSASFPFNKLAADFTGPVEVLIHSDFGHTGYKFEYTTRLSRMGFDVDASGDIIELDDDRATASGSTITFNTVGVTIDVASEATVWKLDTQATPNNTNKGSLGTYTGDQTMTLSPINTGDNGAYSIYGPSGTAEARNSFRIVYDSVADSYSLTTWTDHDGTIILEDQQSITLFDGPILTIEATVLNGTVITVQ